MLASLPLPVVIVTAAAAGERSCTTATAGYLAYDPPLLTTPLRAAGRTCRLLEASGEFSVSILAHGQAELAVRAARPSRADKPAEQELPLLEPPSGWAAPGIAGSVAVYWCRVETTAQVVGSLLVVGKVEEHVVGEALPLLRFRRRYHSLGAAVAVGEEAPYPL